MLDVLDGFGDSQDANTRLVLPKKAGRSCIVHRSSFLCVYVHVLEKIMKKKKKNILVTTLRRQTIVLDT
jgi:hypothetical protein